jgi:hypothetical protein
MRQLAYGSIVLVLVVFGWGAPSVGQQAPTPRGELRVVDKNRQWGDRPGAGPGTRFRV